MTRQELHVADGIRENFTRDEWDRVSACSSRSIADLLFSMI
jgi:hypothetical protein